MSSAWRGSADVRVTDTHTHTEARFYPVRSNLGREFKQTCSRNRKAAFTLNRSKTGFSHLFSFGALWFSAGIQKNPKTCTTRVVEAGKWWMCAMVFTGRMAPLPMTCGSFGSGLYSFGCLPKNTPGFTATPHTHQYLHLLSSYKKLAH